MNQRYFKYLGLLIVVCSLIFVISRVWDVFPDIKIQTFHPRVYLNFFLITVCYSIAVFFVSLAWQNFLVSLGEPSAKFLVCQNIYSRSVIAKYVPVGILEYAGRHVLAGEHGLSQGSVASANLWEILSQVFAACIFILGSLFLSGSMLQFIPPSLLFTILIIFLIIFLGVNKFIKVVPLAAKRFNLYPVKFRFVIVPMILYAIFFFVLSGILVVIISNVTQWLNINEVVYIFSVSTFAWLLGYVTPGAPAGLGIREATLLLGLSDMVGEPNAVLIIGVFRMITVSGDLLYFIFGNLLSRFKES
jgi:glycosyltransferase 2 family protein